MKFSLSRDTLTRLLATSMVAVSSRPSTPVLSCVLIEANQDGSVIFTGQGEQIVRISSKAQVAAAGAVAIPVKKALSVIRSLQSGVIQFEKKRDDVEVTAGSSRFTLKGMDATAFPTPKAMGKALARLEISQGLLKRTLNQVSFAMSSDENRFVLNGVFFKLDAGKLTLVATDGRRLSVATINAGTTEAASAIIPAKSVDDIARNLLDDDTPVSIAFEQNRATFEYAAPKESEYTSLTQATPLVEGTYPNFIQVIPKNSTFVVKVEREAFLAAVQRTALMVSDKNPSIKLLIADNSISVSAESAEFGKAGDCIAVDFAKEESNGPIAFNPGYLVDALRASPDDFIEFLWKDDMSPGVVRYSGDALCVVMPQRVG